MNCFKSRRILSGVLLATLCGLLPLRTAQAQCSGENVLIGTESSGTPTIEEVWDFAVEAGDVIFGTTNGAITATHTLTIGPFGFVTANNSGTCEVDHPDNTAGFTINKTGILKFAQGEITALFLKVIGPTAGEAALGGKLIGAGKFIFPSQTGTTQPVTLQSALINPVGVLTLQVADTGDDVVIANSVYRVEIGGDTASHLNVTDGDVQLTATKLVVDFPAGFTATEGDEFTLMKIGGTRTGTFLNANGTALSEGATVTVNGIDLKISYAGGAGGKDIVLKKEAPVVNIAVNNPAAVSEGSAAAPGSVSFNVTLSNASTKTVAVDYATANGTATAGSDYTAKNGTLSFAPGETTKQVVVNFIGDAIVELDETFFLNLTAPTNATLVDSSGTATIRNDDQPTITLTTAVALNEGNSGTTNAVVTVTLSAATSQTVTVNFATSNGTATAGQDYTATNDTLTFAPGQTSKPINVPVPGDLLDEDNETFSLTLSAPVNATLSAAATATITITDDDAAPSLVVSNPRAFMEGSAASPGFTTFNIILSAPSGKRVTVAYRTADGLVNGAKVGEDYEYRGGTIVLEPGQTRRSIAVPFIGEGIAEMNETFFLDIRTPTNATIADSRGSAYIGNDDGPSIVIDNARSVSEGNSGTTLQNFIVKLSAASTNTITVDWANAPNTAGPADYVTANGRLTFNPGETQKTITIQVKGDTTVETTETYRVNLTRPTFAIMADSQGIGYILNDDVSAGNIIRKAPSK